MATGTKEYHFEEHIEHCLVAEQQTQYGNMSGFALPEYHAVPPSGYDKERCIIPSEEVAFLKETQPKEYERLLDGTGSEERAQKSMLDRLDKELKRGTLDLLRLTSFDAGYGEKFRMVYFQPVSNKTPEHEKWYAQNRRVERPTSHIRQTNSYPSQQRTYTAI